MDKIGTSVESWNNDNFQTNCDDFLKYISIYKEEHKKIRLGGGTIAIENSIIKSASQRERELTILWILKLSFLKWGFMLHGVCMKSMDHLLPLVLSQELE